MTLASHNRPDTHDSSACVCCVCGIGACAIVGLGSKVVRLERTTPSGVVVFVTCKSHNRPDPMTQGPVCVVCVKLGLFVVYVCVVCVVHVAVLGEE